MSSGTSTTATGAACRDRTRRSPGPTRRAHREPSARATPSRRSRPTAVALCIALVLGGLAGCSGRGRGDAAALSLMSLVSEPVALDVRFGDAVYGHESGGDTWIMLSDTTVEDLLAGAVQRAQMTHVEILWSPQAGATPVDPQATNVSIRHVIVADGEMGIYGGAGFAILTGEPGASRLDVTIRDASIRLEESSPGFVDLLSPGRLAGTISARLDVVAARKLNRAASQFVTTRLGRTRFVGATDDDRTTLAQR